MKLGAFFAATLVFSMGAATLAGERFQPPELQAGTVLKVCDHDADGKVSGWVTVSLGGMITVVIEKIEGEKRKPGEDFDVFARAKRVAGQDRPVPLEADVAVIRQAGCGDKVEIAWFRADGQPRAATITVVKSCPRKGTLAGKVVKRENVPLAVEVEKAGPGSEELVGRIVPFFFNFVPNSDKNDQGHRYIVSPEQAKLFPSLAKGDSVEVAYHSENRFRVDSINVTGKAVAAEKPAEKKEPDQERPPEKKAPPPAKKPPVDEDF
jgi:hypothetical protein